MNIQQGTDGSVDIASIIESQASFSCFAKSSITTTAVQLTASSVPANKGVLVKASNSNTGTVYVGASSSVTRGTVDATDGFELGAGEAVSLEANNANLIWLIGSAAGQRVSAMVL